MTAFVLQRLLSVVPVPLIVAVFVFLLVHLTPGDPASYMAGPLATPAEIRYLRDALELDLPLPVQFERWFLKALHGDLGESLFLSIPVPVAIWQRLEPTLLLTIMGAGGRGGDRPAGRRAGGHAPKHVDGPGGHRAHVGRPGDPELLVPLHDGLAGAIRSLLMPAVALGVISAAQVARITRASMLDVLHQDFVRTARAKGVLERAVVWRHTLRNAVLPVLTVVGNSFAVLLGGLVVTEQVSAILGVGLLIVNAVLERDYPVIQGAMLYLITIYVFINGGMDILYALADPRIKFANQLV